MRWAQNSLTQHHPPTFISLQSDCRLDCACQHFFRNPLLLHANLRNFAHFFFRFFCPGFCSPSSASNFPRRSFPKPPPRRSAVSWTGTAEPALNAIAYYVHEPARPTYPFRSFGSGCATLVRHKQCQNRVRRTRGLRPRPRPIPISAFSLDRANWHERARPTANPIAGNRPLAKSSRKVGVSQEPRDQALRLPSVPVNN